MVSLHAPFRPLTWWEDLGARGWEGQGGLTAAIQLSLPFVLDAFCSFPSRGSSWGGWWPLYPVVLGRPCLWGPLPPLPVAMVRWTRVGPGCWPPFCLTCRFVCCPPLSCLSPDIQVGFLKSALVVITVISNFCPEDFYLFLFKIKST